MFWHQQHCLEHPQCWATPFLFSVLGTRQVGTNTICGCATRRALILQHKMLREMQDSTQLYKQLSTEINSMSKQLGEQYQTLSQKVQGMESRLQGLENHMEEMVQNLEYIVSVQTRTQGSSPCLE
mmetsp:Transcript_14490/g.32040  ORF Transcript_14490/g.32040 Transcript_14490/m.32040 type:complete len:125 (+) Transcript_14490:1026-1400(+)